MDLSNVTQIFLDGTEVIQITDSQGHTMWQKEEPVVLDLFYIKNEAQNTGTLTITNGGGTLRYSTDAVNWTDYDFTTHPTISVAAGDKLYLKGAKSNPSSGPMKLSMNVSHSIGGNILSVVDEDNYTTMTTIPAYSLYSLFNSDSQLTDASDVNFGLATTAYQNSLASLFYDCTSLVEGPDLSTLTTLYDFALLATFRGCTALAVAPDLSHITSAATNGLYCTFYGCTSLVTAPSLASLTSTSSYAMSMMYNGCTSLTTPSNVTSLSRLSNNTMQGMYNGCTSLVTGADLRGITHTDYHALDSLYNGCTSLTTAYAPTVSTWEHATDWLANVAATGTVYCATQAIADAIPTNSTSGVPSGWVTDPPQTPPVPPTPTVDYFYIQDESGNGLNLYSEFYSDTFELEYSLDNCATWNTVNVEDLEMNVQIPADGRMYMRGIYDVAQCILYFSLDDEFSVGGNILSLVDKDNYDTITTVDTYQFESLFNGSTTLLDASQLNFGNATTLNASALAAMFKGCTSLVQGPDISNITTAGNQAMQNMYQNCSLLTTASEMGITTVNQLTCSGMYSGCRSLTSTPDLTSITTVGSHAMESMFYQCTSLTTISNLSNITTVAAYGLSAIFSGCTSLTTGTQLNGITEWQGESMLRAMYAGCTSLTTAYAPFIFSISTAAIHQWSSNNSYTYNWLNNVAASGTLYFKSPMPGFAKPPTNDVSGCPSGWTLSSIS